MVSIKLLWHTHTHAYIKTRAMFWKTWLGQWFCVAQQIRFQWNFYAISRLIRAKQCGSGHIVAIDPTSRSFLNYVLSIDNPWLSLHILRITSTYHVCDFYFILEDYLYCFYIQLFIRFGFCWLLLYCILICFVINIIFCFICIILSSIMITFDQ